MECGVSQSEQELGLDAQQWLLRSMDTEAVGGDQDRGVRCVVLVKILEGPTAQPLGQSDTDSDDDGSLPAYDSDESTMAMYKKVKTRFVNFPGLFNCSVGG